MQKQRMKKPEGPTRSLNHWQNILSVVEKILVNPDINKIKINGKGIIEIVNWHHYQSQAGYMRSYREGHKSKKYKKKS